MQPRVTVVNATVWVAMGRVMLKSIAVTQLIVFGRILGPDVIAVYAVAALVLGIVEMLTEQGLSTALIQKQGDISPYLSTVWFVNVIRGLILFVILISISNLLANWFSSPQSGHLIAAISVVPLVRGFENLANVIFSKSLEFKKLVIVELFASIIGFLSGLTWLFFFGGAISLVVVAIVSALANVIGSYRLLPTFHGFSFSLKLYRQLQRYGFWVMLSRYAAVGLTKGGGVAIGTLVGPLSLSYYQYADQLATSATMEISRLANRVALPVFSRAQSDRTELASSFENAFSCIGIVSLLCLSFLVGNSQLFVTFLLGEDWLPVAKLIPWIALWGVTRSLGACVTYGLMAVGKPHAATVYQWMMLAFFVIGVYPVATKFGAIGVCILLASIGLLVQFFRYPMVSREVGLPVKRLLILILVPALAAIVACALNLVVIRSLLGTPDAVVLVLGLLVNFIAYSAFLLTFWRAVPTYEPVVLREICAQFNQRLGRL